jgi:hypothetical protein
MGRILEMEWPEAGVKVESEPLSFNQDFYEYFLDNCPLKGIQSHAVVSGKLLYIMNLKLSKFPSRRYMELKMEDLSEAPLGRIFIFITAGKVGSVMVKYGDITEPMSYPTIAQVKKEDLEKIKQAGRAEWNSIYRNKEIISVYYRAK